MKGIEVIGLGMMVLSSLFAHHNACAAEPKRAILVVSFGTSVAATRQATIEACERQIQAAFPDDAVRRAFTSSTIIKMLKTRDQIEVDTPESALQRLQQEGFTEVIVQPLHVIAGLEFHEIVMTAKAFHSAFSRIQIGMPLLAAPEDFVAVANALKAQFPKLEGDEAVVLMGHGTPHPANAAYLALEHVFRQIGMERAFLGTVEGSPTLDEVIAQLRAESIRKVTLLPFMLVAGDHALHDMAGDAEDSWKSRLQRAGFAVNVVLRGLGADPAIQAIYARHVQNAIERAGSGNEAGSEDASKHKNLSIN